MAHEDRNAILRLALLKGIFRHGIGRDIELAEGWLPRAATNGGMIRASFRLVFEGGGDGLFGIEFSS